MRRGSQKGDDVTQAEGDQYPAQTSGSASTPRPTTGKKWSPTKIAIVTVIALGAFIWWLTATISEVGDQRDLIAHGTTVDAMVTHRSTESAGRGGENYYIDYTFPTASGGMHSESHHKVEESVYDAIGGDTGIIRVTYLRDRPDVNMPTTSLHVLGQAASIPIYIIGFIVAAVAGTVVFLWLQRISQRVARNKLVTSFIPGVFGIHSRKPTAAIAVGLAICYFGGNGALHLIARMLF